MSEVIDDKVDNFHESLMKRYSRKTLVAAIIFVVLFCSWYVHATYKEYDFWVPEDNWQLIREIEIVNGIVTKFNISMTMNMGFLAWGMGVNATATTDTINRTYGNGTTYYWQIAVLADARFEELYHLRDLLGYRLSETPLRDCRMSFHCYPTLFRFLGSNYNTTNTIEMDSLSQLRTIALNRFAKLYHELMQLPREVLMKP
jgi:hypothetical protein